MTVEERRDQRNLLELMIQIGEDYQRINGCDHELFTVLALDAKGLPNRRLTPTDAAALLADAACGANEKLAAASAAATKH